MALGTKNRKPLATDSGTTVIAQGTRFVGDVKSDSALHVDGEVHGTVNASGDVSVGVSGRVIGKICANHLLVSGLVEGDLECERVEIVHDGKVYGDVVCEELIIEPGGRFFGSSYPRDREAHPVHNSLLVQKAEGGEASNDAIDELPAFAARTPS